MEKNKELNILVICDSLLPPAIFVLGMKGIYGIQRKLAESGARVNILTSAETGLSSGWEAWVKNEERKYGIRFQVIKLPFKGLSWLRFLILRFLFFIRGWRLQRISGCNIVHQYSSSPILMNLTYLLGKLSKAKSVHTFCTINNKFWGRKNPFLMTTDRVICVTGSLRKKLNKAPTGKNIEVIPVPVDEVFFNPSLARNNRKFGINTQKAVLFSGLLDERKGIVCFLKAIPEILSGNPDTSVVILTPSGFNTSRIARQNRERVLACVEIYLGRVSFIEAEVSMPEILSAVDILAYPILTMHGTLGTPLILLEGMAMGKAVVASNLPEVAEIIKDGQNGLLFNPGDSRELSLGINKLLSVETLRQRLGSQAKQQIEKYRSSEVCGKIMGLYQDLLEGN